MQFEWAVGRRNQLLCSAPLLVCSATSVNNNLRICGDWEEIHVTVVFPHDILTFDPHGMMRKWQYEGRMSCCLRRRQSHDFSTFKASQSAECPGEEKSSTWPCPLSRRVHTSLPRLVDPKEKVGLWHACMGGMWRVSA